MWFLADISKLGICHEQKWELIKRREPAVLGATWVKNAQYSEDNGAAE